MLRLFTNLVNAKKFTTANLLCRERRYKEAYNVLRKIDLSDIRVDRFVEYLALRGFVAFCLGEFDDAADCCEGVFKYLPEASSFSANDKRYLEAYTAKFYSELKNKVSMITSDKNIEAKINYSQIDLANVRPKLKRVFPLRGHPDWE